MSIIGIGVDIINNNRLKKLVKNKIFVSRVFTKNEQKFSKKLKNKVNYIIICDKNDLLKYLSIINFGCH